MTNTIDTKEKRLAKLIKMQAGEHCTMIVRKHWFIFVRDAFGIFFATLLAWVMVAVVLKVINVAEPIISFWQAWIALVGLLAIFVRWTNYFLDMWIVTNKRVIHVDQKNLFSRTITATRIDRVQDVRAKVKGIIATLLGFGDLHVQTAGADSANMLINGIPRPNDVRLEILKRLDQAIDGHANIHNKDGIGHS